MKKKFGSSSVSNCGDVYGVSSIGSYITRNESINKSKVVKKRHVQKHDYDSEGDED